MPPAIAHLEFQPVPPSQRRTPGRIAYPSARLYIDRFVEHREAHNFLQQQMDLYNDASNTLVRAIIHYRDTVLLPLEAFRERQAKSKRKLTIPSEIERTQIAFHPLTPRQRENPERVKNTSVRLYVDRWQEHREAYEILKSRQELYGHGEAQKTIVRAVLHYRDTVVKPSLKKTVEGKQGQMRMDIRS